jgi:predicted nucleotidyltransferase
MLTTDIQQTIINRIKPYKPKRIGVFGPWSRGEQTEDSDIDILVDFENGINLLDLIGLEQDLTDILGVKVDLVTEASVHPALKSFIYADLKMLWNEEG